MNADTPEPDRHALEARLTALLLGELTVEEAATLRAAIERDPELAKLHERLKLTVALVRETVASPAEQTEAQVAPVRLSEQRRQELLAHFKTIAPKEFHPVHRRAMSWLVPAAAAAALIMFLAAVAIPNFVKSRTTSLSGSIVNNLRQLDGAKQQWALEHNKSGTDLATFNDLTPYLRSSGISPLPSVSGETYVPGTVEGPVGAELSDRQAKKLMAELPTGLSSGDPDRRRVVLSPDGRLALATRNARVSQAAGQVRSDFDGGKRGPALIAFGPAPSAASHVEIALPRTQDSSASENSAGDLELAYRLGTEGVAPLPLTPPPSASPGLGQTPSEVAVSPVPALKGGAGQLVFKTWSLSEGDSVPMQVPPAESGLAFRLDESGKTPQPNPPPPSASPALAQNLSEVAANLPSSGAVDPVTGLPLGPATLGSHGSEQAGLSGGGANGSGVSSYSGTISSRRYSALRQPSAPPAGRPPVAAETDAYSVNVVGYVNVPLSSTNSVAFVPLQSENSGKLFQGGTGGGGGRAGTQLGWGGANGLDRLGAPVRAEPGSSFQNRTKQELVKSPAQELAVNESVLRQAETIAQHNKLADARAEVDRLRQELKISNATASTGGPTTLMSGDTLRRLEGLRNENEAEYRKDKALLDQFRNRRPEELGQAILRSGVKDSLLSSLVEQRSLAEQKLAIVKQENKDEAQMARLASQVADLDEKIKARGEGITAGLETQVAALQIANAKKEVARLEKERMQAAVPEADVALRKPAPNAPIPEPEIQTRDNAFSTFSLNVSDVSFKLAAASLEKGLMPEPSSVRSEEFINAFDYRDPEPAPGAPIGFAWERARYPYVQNRDLLRFSLKTAAQGREAGRPLNLVLLLDNSGSMERADRVRIIHEALRVLATQLQAQDTFSVVTFARTARLWVDGVPGSQAGQVAEEVGGLTPQGGTNLEEAMNLAYATALRHYLAHGVNRVVLLTDGAANLGNVEPETLKQKVDAQRKQGISLDCFGIGWEGYNDDLLEVLTRNGNGRYGFINTPEEAATEFAGQLAGALRVAASDVKAQVEFNPARVTAYRQLGYAKHQLTKEQFRDNTVTAAEIGAAEAGNALYVVEVNPAGEGPVATVRVRYRVPGTSDYHEHEWTVPYNGSAVGLEQASPAMRLAATASAFSEWLVSSPYATEVTLDSLLGHLRGVPEVYGADARPKKLEWMIRQAKSVAGR